MNQFPQYEYENASENSHESYQQNKHVLETIRKLNSLNIDVSSDIDVKSHVAEQQRHRVRVAIVGGGIAGATAALWLANAGATVKLFESKESLCDGPPYCHLHAGGLLYPSIPHEEGISLLRHSVAFARTFKHSINTRPTIIALRKADTHDPNFMIERCRVVAAEYARMVEDDARNRVLGDPSEYYRVYSEQDILRLRELAISSGCNYSNGSMIQKKPNNMDEWMYPFVLYTDLSQIKYPVLLVREPGISVLRTAATLELALEELHDTCTVHCDTRVTSCVRTDNSQHSWRVEYMSAHLPVQSSHSFPHDPLNDSNTFCSDSTTKSDQHMSTTVWEADIVVNAAGWESGRIDDSAQHIQPRLAELKGTYLIQAPDAHGYWPEIALIGPRDTPQGLVQVTPYTGGVFQIHALARDCTLFEGGLTSCHEGTSQPEVSELASSLVKEGWKSDLATQRTMSAVRHTSSLLSVFSSASPAALPLWGIQQIPGTNAERRAADVILYDDGYAVLPIVKAVSAVAAASKLRNELIRRGLLTLVSKSTCSTEGSHCSSNDVWPASDVSAFQIASRARALARHRGLPVDLAQLYPDDARSQQTNATQPSLRVDAHCLKKQILDAASGKGSPVTPANLDPTVELLQGLDLETTSF